MPTYTIDFCVPEPSTIELPQHLLRDGGKYAVEVKDGDVTIWGNSAGLLYLAEVIVRCAIGGHPSTLHVHLPQDGSVARKGPTVGIQPELTIFASDPDFG